MTSNEFINARRTHSSRPEGRVAWELTDQLLIGDLLLNDIGVVIQSLHFIRCTFQDKLVVNQSSGFTTIIFSECVFKNTVQFETIVSNLTWEKCLFEKDLIVNGGRNNVTLSGFNIMGTLEMRANFEQNLIVADINCASSEENLGSFKCTSVGFSRLEIRNSRFIQVDLTRARGIINIDQLTANMLNINHAAFVNWFRVQQCNLGDLKIDNLSSGPKLVELKENEVAVLWIACHMVEQLSIERGVYGLCRFWGDVKKDTIIEVRSGVFQSLIFDEVFNEGRVSFRGVTIQKNGHLAILGSTLGKCSFIKCDFSAGWFKFDNSKISEIFVAETDFPKHVGGENEVNFSQAQLAFGQLHTAFEKQGDTVRSLDYQAREISAHYGRIPLWISFAKPNFTKASLWLNKLSNDFGRDWGRGVVFSLGVGLLFFFLLLWTTDNYSIHGLWRWDDRLVPSFFRFMNPLRFFDLETLFTKDKVSLVSLNSSSYFVDFFGRVWLAYGYYQTIQAFRRYGRK